MVPHLPPQIKLLSDYYHHHNEIWVNGSKDVYCNDNYLEDPNCSASKWYAPSVNDHLKIWGITLGALIHSQTNGNNRNTSTPMSLSMSTFYRQMSDVQVSKYYARLAGAAYCNDRNSRNWPYYRCNEAPIQHQGTPFNKEQEPKLL
ncbi:hypothetical protein K502DRAFT_353971 [Neoconidiobolus thromboides FSU 785]|nr:hypothetical protein K502DRAFT_353971 [Neoconidiobolus thromboides FSU 785]